MNITYDFTGQVALVTGAGSGMVLAPIANGDPAAPRFFTAREPYSSVSPVAFRLSSVEAVGDSVVWLRYTVQPETA